MVRDDIVRKKVNTYFKQYNMVKVRYPQETSRVEKSLGENIEEGVTCLVNILLSGILPSILTNDELSHARDSLKRFLEEENPDEGGEASKGDVAEGRLKKRLAVALNRAIEKQRLVLPTDAVGFDPLAWDDLLVKLASDKQMQGLDGRFVVSRGGPNYREFPLAFISSPYNGDGWEIVENVKRARAMCQWAMEHGFAPFASHLIYTQFLDDSIKHEREMGIEIGRAFIKKCSVVISYGGRKSEGTLGDDVVSTEEGVRNIILFDEDLAPYYKENPFLPPWVKA
jgi:hypothetical protein